MCHWQLEEFVPQSRILHKGASSPPSSISPSGGLGFIAWRFEKRKCRGDLTIVLQYCHIKPTLCHITVWRAFKYPMVFVLLTSIVYYHWMTEEFSHLSIISLKYERAIPQIVPFLWEEARFIARRLRRSQNREVPREFQNICTVLLINLY